MLRNALTVRMGMLVACLLTFGMLAGGLAADQQDGFPPWPIVLKGNVALDGKAVNDGRLSVRVGDWESKEVPVVDGKFRCSDPCLIAGPPSASYIGELVTFVLDGKWETDLGFTFPQNASPEIMEVSLGFDSTRVVGIPVPTKGYADSDGNGNRLWVVALLAIFVITPLLLIGYRRITRRRLTDRST